MRRHPGPRPRDDHHVERRAGWLELFHDLACAVAVSQPAHRLCPDLTPLAFVRVLGPFVPVCRAWVGRTRYSTRFDSDGPLPRVLAPAQMLFAAVMTVQVAGTRYDDVRGIALFTLLFRGESPAAEVRGLAEANPRLVSFVAAKEVTVPGTVSGGRAWPPLAAAFLAVLAFVAHGGTPALVAMTRLAALFVALVVLHERERGRAEAA